MIYYIYVIEICAALLGGRVIYLLFNGEEGAVRRVQTVQNTPNMSAIKSDEITFMHPY